MSSNEVSKLKETRHNLPPPLTRFIGRGQELAEIGRLLQSTRYAIENGLV